MSYTVRFANDAKTDVLRLIEYLNDQDQLAANKARQALERSFNLLRQFSFSCRKLDPSNPFLRELLIPFGNAGYVALLEIESSEIVTILAVRHQREQDYH